MRRFLGLVNDFFDLVNDFALTGRPALMHAVIFISKEFAIDMKNPDFEVALRDYLPVAVTELFGSTHV